jgi:hypothetical protein
MEDCILTLAVDGSHTRIVFAKVRDFRVLLLRRYRNLASTPSVAPFLKQRVIQLAGYIKHEAQFRFLSR